MTSTMAESAKTRPATPYAFGVRVPYGHAEAVAKVREVLKTEGFGILTEIDVQKAMKEKLGQDMARYLILGACNPPLAHRALQVEKEIGALLPCNVVVYEDPDAGRQTVVIAQDPVAGMGLVGNEALTPIGTEARQRLERALNSLGGQPR